MPRLESRLPEIFVQPGESHLVAQPSILRTVLGSCVGITFLVPRLGIGVLCHPMMPRFPERRKVEFVAFAGRRYVDYAIREIARQLDSRGVQRVETIVKLFGGADVLAHAERQARPTIGKLNSEAALRVLEEEGFIVAASRLGGNAGIHIRFETLTGEVLLRRLDAV